MQRILLREVVIDAPSETFAAVRDFWVTAAVPRRVWPAKTIARKWPDGSGSM